MIKNVRPDFPFGVVSGKPGTILRSGMEYSAISNPHGAICGICENGEHLGVKPGEFEFIDAPEWILKIHNGIKPDHKHKTHHLKTWPEYFKVIKSGKKTFEIRWNDRDYQVGDVLVLEEYDPYTGYTGDTVTLDVPYVLDKQPFVPQGYICMAVKEWID